MKQRMLDAVKRNLNWFRQSGVMDPADGRWGVGERVVVTEGNTEADKIIAAMPKDSYKIALCVEGRQYDSPALAEIISDATDATGKISLVIGSSHGLSERVKSECKLRLSVSKMTFPHQLMRVILFEALYRSFTIIAGKKYHK